MQQWSAQDDHITLPVGTMQAATWMWQYSDGQGKWQRKYVHQLFTLELVWLVYLMGKIQMESIVVQLLKPNGVYQPPI